MLKQKQKEMHHLTKKFIDSKQLSFYETRVKHTKLTRLMDDLTTLLTPHSETNIIVITGAPGVGKTTMAKWLSERLNSYYEIESDSDQSAIPVVSIEAYANGERKHSFKPIFQDVLIKLYEPGLGKKTYSETKEDKIVVNHSRRSSIAALRRLVESALTYRKTKVWIIDEAYHLIRISRDSAILDTLKSIANTAGTKLVLMGSFDMLDLVVDHGQVARRTSILSLERYYLDRPEDRHEFKTIVKALQDRWPCDQIPNFKNISDELLEVTFGCVGLLKSLLLEACAMQLHNGGIWNGAFLKKAAKSNALLQAMRREIEIGETKVREALYGSTIWTPETLALLTCRMEQPDA